MKYPKEQFELLVDGLKVIVPYFGVTKEIPITVSLMHDLYFRVCSNYTYPIENGNVKLDINGNRILPLNESFELYPNNCVDDNIETAMKAALKIVFNN